jgi:hypothetical protein
MPLKESHIGGHFPRHGRLARGEIIIETFKADGPEGWRVPGKFGDGYGK